MTKPSWGYIEDLGCEMADAEMLGSVVHETLVHAKGELERLAQWAHDGAISIDPTLLQRRIQKLESLIYEAKLRAGAVEACATGLGLISSTAELKARQDSFAYAQLNVVALLLGDDMDSDNLIRN